MLNTSAPSPDTISNPHNKRDSRRRSEGRTVNVESATTDGRDGGRGLAESGAGGGEGGTGEHDDEEWR